MPSLLKMQVEELGGAIASGKLPEKDHRFAKSLCDSFWAYRLSPKQAAWVEKLLARVNTPATQHVPEQVGNMGGVLALFAKARQHLKYPAILLMLEDGQTVLRLNVAGAQARVPGSINVTDRDKYQGERRVWYGRVTPSGEWQPGNSLPPESMSAISRALKALASDPAGTAASYGRLTGHCCFCNLRLTDERSTAVGYGKICAGHYDLPWGEARHDFRDHGVKSMEGKFAEPDSVDRADAFYSDAIGF